MKITPFGSTGGSLSRVAYAVLLLDLAKANARVREIINATG
jgi:hypothetical protein